MTNYQPYFGKKYLVLISKEKTKKKDINDIILDYYDSVGDSVNRT